MARLLVLRLVPLLILAGCQPPAPPPETKTVTTPVTEDVTFDVTKLPQVKTFPLPEPEPAKMAPLPEPVSVPPSQPSGPGPQIDPRAVAFIVREEVISEAYYRKRLLRPVCPACRTTPSGPTIGIGSDLGHLTREGVDEFWADHPQKDRLYAGVGVTGLAAIPVTASLQDVLTPYPLAYGIFSEKQLITFWTACRRAFGAYAWDRARSSATGSLVATCYNRGTAMTGGRRSELREIRDTFLPEQDYSGAAGAFRRSKRLFTKTPGLLRRYDKTAEMMENP